MAICTRCERDMKKTDTCLEWAGKFEGGLVLNGVPFHSTDEKDTCADCGVHVGGYHHPRCDQEICPRCGGQWMSCFCTILDAD